MAQAYPKSEAHILAFINAISGEGKKKAVDQYHLTFGKGLTQKLQNRVNPYNGFWEGYLLLDYAQKNQDILGGPVGIEKLEKRSGAHNGDISYRSRLTGNNSIPEDQVRNYVNLIFDQIISSKENYQRIDCIYDLLKFCSEQGGDEGTVISCFFRLEDKDEGKDPAAEAIKRLNQALRDIKREMEGEPAEPLPCPYKGLSSFTVADSKFFFGRDEDIDNIRRKIEKRPFVAVLGSSGSGKSSVVHGGVIPSLPKPPQSSEPEAKSGWSCITFKPSLSSQNPFLALAEVLYRDIPSERFQDGDDKKAVIEDKLKNTSEATASKWLVDYLEDIQKHKNSSYLLLVIDQFEELFTPDYQDDRNAFIELLRVTADKQSDTLRIVITMRSDYLPRAEAECIDFYNLITDEDNHYFVTVINGKDRFRDIITEPAKQNGVEFQEEAVNAILDDLLQGGSQANILPLLEYALTEIWKHREGRKITVQAVEKVGDVLDFLPDKAEAFYQSDKHSDNDRKTILRIFLNLANFLEVKTDNLYSKSTQRWDSQPDSPEAKREWELIQTLAGDKDGYRFLNITYDDSDQDKKHPYVEVVHDILLTTWTSLRTELDRNIPFFIWNKETKDNAKAWLENGKDEKYLLSGRSLAKAEDYLNSARILDVDTIKFIEASAAYHQQKERTIKRVRTASISTLVVLLFFSAIAAIGLNEKTEEAELKNRRLLAEISSSFLKEGEVRLAILTALEALENNTQAKSRDETSYQKAFSTLIGSMGEYVEMQRHYIPGLDRSSKHIVTSDLETVIFDSDSYEKDRKAYAWDLSKNETLLELGNAPKIVDKFQLSRSGKLVTLTSHDGVTGKTWDLDKQRQLLDFTGRDIREIYVSKNKKYFMSRDGSGYSSIGYIDPITHTISEIFSVSDDERLALSPDGCCFYHGNQEGLSIYKINDLNYQFEKIIENVKNSRFIFSLDQRFILAFGEDGTLRYNYTSNFIANGTLIDIDTSDFPDIEIEKQKLLLSEDGNFFAIVVPLPYLGYYDNLLHVFHLPSGSYLNTFSEGYVDFTETVLDVSLSSGHIITRGRNYDRAISSNVFDLLSRESRTFRKKSSSVDSYSQTELIPYSRNISAINEKYSFLSIFDQISFPDLILKPFSGFEEVSSEFSGDGHVKIKYSSEKDGDEIIRTKHWHVGTEDFLNYRSMHKKRRIYGDIDLNSLVRLNNCGIYSEFNLMCDSVESNNGRYKLMADLHERGSKVSLVDNDRNVSVELFEVDGESGFLYGGFFANDDMVFVQSKNSFQIWNTRAGSKYKEWDVSHGFASAGLGDDFSLNIIISKVIADKNSGYVFFEGFLGRSNNSGKRLVFVFDLFKGEFFQHYEFFGKYEVFYQDDAGYLLAIYGDKDIYLKRMSTGEDIFKFFNASSDVIDVDFNADTNSILWTQSTGEVFIANIDNWSEENLIDAFRELTIRPLTQSERENFNLN